MIRSVVTQLAWLAWNIVSMEAGARLRLLA